MNNKLQKKIQKKLPIELKRYIIKFIPLDYCSYCNKKTVYYRNDHHNYTLFYCSLFCHYRHNSIALCKIFIVLVYFFSLQMYFFLLVIKYIFLECIIYYTRHILYHYWLSIIMLILLKLNIMDELPY